MSAYIKRTAVLENDDGDRKFVPFHFKDGEEPKDVAMALLTTRKGWRLVEIIK